MNVLDTPLRHQNGTLRFWFIAAMAVLWREGEGFSGKRPFGDSGWDYDLINSVAEARGLTTWDDEAGDWEPISQEQEDQIVLEVARAFEDWANTLEVSE